MAAGHISVRVRQLSSAIGELRGESEPALQSPDPAEQGAVVLICAALEQA